MSKNYKTTIKTYESSFDLMLLSGDLINIENDLSSINWQRKYFNQAGIIFNRTANKDYIFAALQVSAPSQITIFRTTPNGVLIWAKFIESWNDLNTNDLVGFHYIKEDTNGNIIASSNIGATGSSSLTVVLEENGNYVLDYITPTALNHKITLENNTCLLSGFDGDFFNINSSNFVLENRNLTTIYPCDTVENHAISEGTDMPLTPNTLVFNPRTFTTETLNLIVSPGVPITQNVFCDLQLGVNKKTRPLGSSIYPNPTRDKVWIKNLSKIIEINLFNALGKHLTTTTSPVIDMSAFSSGIYFLEIKTENNHSEIKKIIRN